MYREPGSSSGSNASTKGDEVELVSRFLAPLCARDETARNIALEAARSTVEGWLGGVGSPNQWEDNGEMEDGSTDRFGKSQDGRYDIRTNVQRSPTKSVPRSLHGAPELYGTEGFFPQSVTENPAFPEDGNAEKQLSGSYDCVDGRLGSDASCGASYERRRFASESFEGYKSGHSTSSDEGKGHARSESARRFRFRENVCDPVSCDAEESYTQSRKYVGSTSHELTAETVPKSHMKVKGAKQKQLEDNELDPGTRIYGKSPKFDENFGGIGLRESTNSNFHPRALGFRARAHEWGFPRSEDAEVEVLAGPRFPGGNDEGSVDEDGEVSCEGVVFNTLEGFDRDIQAAKAREDEENMNLENYGGVYLHREAKSSLEDHTQPKDDFRKDNERKHSAGQIKRPLSQDEDVANKSGRVLESPEVTPGDVGRLLNLGNALDGPRQAQPNKYLSLVTLHLPVILRLSVNCPFQNVRIKCAEILEMVKDRGLPVPVPAFDGPSAFVPTSECVRQSVIKDKSQGLRRRRDHAENRSRENRLIAMTEMTRMLLQEPGWKLERKGSALLLRRDSSHLKSARVCFRCDVEVREYERDEEYATEVEPEAAASPLAMCASCLAALCVTVVLPWLLIGG